MVYLCKLYNLERLHFLWWQQPPLTSPIGSYVIQRWMSFPFPSPQTYAINNLSKVTMKWLGSDSNSQPSDCMARTHYSTASIFLLVYNTACLIHSFSSDNAIKFTFYFKLIDTIIIMWSIYIEPLDEYTTEVLPQWLLWTGNWWMFKCFRRSVIEMMICSGYGHSRGLDQLM